MSLANYTDLKNSIASWSHRADLSNVMDDFIDLAEERMAGDLRVRELETSTTGTLSVATLALPADFAQLRRLTINTTSHYTPENISPDGLVLKHEAAAGLPAYYALVGSNIEFNRSPDSAYGYTLNYWKRVPALSATAATNDVLTNYPSVYLFASLMELAWYAKNDADIQRYAAKYKNAVSIANERSRQPGGPMRVVVA